ncbi:hypothetical protein acdb102_32720 [Acidothermaceae bacterium B102]|nr:hypothetical protein acdb102_32720 [Acidothermaceae bacterium B102]
MPPLRRPLVRSFAAVVSAGVALSGLTLINGTASAAAAPTALHVDFGPKASVAPHGYVVDYGRAWSSTLGYGWTKAGTTKALTLTANTAKRSSKLSPDRRYDTLIALQAAKGHGVTTAGQWQATLANGVYNVTVAVGDAAAIDSVDRITAQPGSKTQVVLVGNFKPTKAHHFFTVTKKVRVSNGRLVLSPTGGRNTKLDYVIATPVKATTPVVAPTTPPTSPVVTSDTIAPTASVVLTGTLLSGTTYSGPVVATINASDNAGGSGLKSVTYSLDGAAAQAYTAPVAVPSAGTHTLTVALVDKAGNLGSATSSWTQQAIVVTAPDTTSPTVAVGVAGTTANSGNYVGDVTVSVTAVDETGGSGIDTVTYTLDGGVATAYTGPFVVHGVGSHMVQVTATDHAGNTGNASAGWVSQAPDTTPPTASIALTGTSPSAGVYTGTVTATVTAADETGGSGLASVSYVLDGGTALAYTVPLHVTAAGAHTLAVTAVDNQGNTTNTSASWTIQTTDTTAPSASIALSGTLTGPSSYSGPVTATVTAADETNGSGLKSTTYTLDGGASSAYTSPVQVSSSGSHTLVVTVKDNAGNTGTATATWSEQISSATALLVTSPDDAVTANPSTPRLVFSSVRGSADPAPRAFTFANTGTAPLTVSNLAIGGTNASNWILAAGQVTSFTLAPGASAQVSIQFHPTDPTGCASTASPFDIGDVDRYATLTYSTDDPATPTGFDILSGVNSCFTGGNNEPVLDQLLPALGYTDVVDTQYIDRRFIGPLRWQQGTDEIQSPYFNAADSTQPVSLVPLAHYGSPNTSTPYQSTGWYLKGSTMTSPNSTCPTGATTPCKSLWKFPVDSTVNGVTVYNQDQDLLPTPTGVTTFTPAGTFGLFSGDFSDVNFSDDSLNVGHTTSNTALPVPHYLHDMRVYPAYGPGHVAIPNTYIVAIDLSRVPKYKNNDYQDVILLLRNAVPALTQATVVNATNNVVDLTTGGTVTGTCGVTGFDGIVANTAGTQCNAANIGFTASGLALTSTPGQLADGNQQNALYKSFDASRSAFTVTARVVGPVTQLTTNYQQIAAFFGPDQSNFIKVEAEHNGAGDPHLTMFYDVKGVSSTVATVAVPDITTASTLDLIIQGNTNLPDPLPYGDTYGVHGFPLDVLTVSYSINGAAPVQIGTTSVSPADVSTWFSRNARAGILVANPGTGAPSLTATFSKFSITSP